MLYLYAFVPTCAGIPAVAGFAGSYLVLVPLGSVSAVATEIDGALEPSDENVLAHARVVDALAVANDAVLPARFGRGFRSVEELEAAVGPLARELERRLDDVRGCVELGLHVVAPEHVSTPASSGAEYMRRRLHDLAEAEARADLIHAPLAEHARASVRARGAAATALLRAAYLVPRDDVETFRARVEDLQHRHTDLAFACTGPWPPYSFAAPEAEGALA